MSGDKMCGNVSEYITHGSPERVGVTCALPRFHANRYHATADGRHEWHVDDAHWIAALADRDAVLRDVEWASYGTGGEPLCPSCGGYQPEGHVDDCKLAAVLGPEGPR